jgi:predicted permease
LFAARHNLSDQLKEGGRSGGYGKHQQVLRFIFVVTQVALALVLLVGSGLLVRSFQRVMAVNAGFRAEHLTTATVYLPKAEYPRPEQVQSFLNQLLTELQHSPGVEATAASSDIPLRGGWTKLVTPEGYDPPSGSSLNPSLNTVVQGDYFSAMGIPLIAGRLFTADESVNGSHVVIVSESLAQKYFPGGDAVGRRLKFGTLQQPSPWLNIVGLVADVKQVALEENNIPHTYVPMSVDQIPALQRIGGVSAQLSVRGSATLESAASALRAAVWRQDRQLPVTQVMLMDAVVDQSTSPRRFTMAIVIGFSAAAVLLASVGLYGVMAYMVSQRTREIGVRMALGAQKSHITRLVLGNGMLMTATGIVMGLTGSLFVMNLLREFLFGVGAVDPLTFILVPGLVILVALTATYIPAMRATRVDPMIALRSE